MQYCVYKLRFKTPVHFGTGRLTQSQLTIYADTLFSAFCKEALKIYGEDGIKKLYQLAKSDDFVLSDTMPYRGDILYIPKPIMPIKADKQGNSKLKKKFKKLQYIPMEDLKKYISGDYIPEIASFGKSDIRANVKINSNADNEPYTIGIYNFGNPDDAEEYGLYFIVGTSKNEINPFINEIINSLAYTGLGGKITSGLGKFDYTYKDISDKNLIKTFEGNYKLYMSLSVCMADEKEIDAIIPNASYELIKRSGFVASENYAENPIKKQDFYCFKGGSCFDKKFQGNIFDVSTGGNHSVYRYAKPFLIGIKE